VRARSSPTSISRADDQVQNQATIEKAEDENSQSLSVAPNGQPELERRVLQNGWCRIRSCHLITTAQSSHKLATLKGAIRVTVAADVDKSSSPI